MIKKTIMMAVVAKAVANCDLSPALLTTKGVFLVNAKNAFVPVKRDNSVNTYLRISTVPRGSEQSE